VLVLDGTRSVALRGVGATCASLMRMSAIPPPPFAGVDDEAYEVRRQCGRALTSLRAGRGTEAERERRGSWLRSLLRLAVLGAVAVVVTLTTRRAVRAIASR